MSFYEFKGNEQGFTISWYSDPRRQFAAFGQGYWNSANLLANSLLHSPGYPDYDAYPVVFLYRHAFELGLKNIIYECARIGSFLNIEGLDNALKNHHDLNKLANVSANALNLIFPHLSEELNDTIQRIRITAREFHQIDPNSYSFRYPITTSGKHSTAKGLNLGVRSISDHMNKLLDDLDTIDFGLNIEADRSEKVFSLIQEFIEGD